ncbi:hypothetical protein [Streptomyces griseoluteus]|uniref:hypothetical protein n=1 Tax=Streptomyces griseoluteus TaxID=29306 RepID=UPI0036FD861B
MRPPIAGSAPVTCVEITASTVQRGDVIQLGGYAYRVSDLLQLPHGAKQLVFESGELLTMHTRIRLVAVRPMRRR